MSMPLLNTVALVRALSPGATALALAIIVAAPAGASGAAGPVQDPDVALCLEAWQAEQEAHGGGTLTLFAHEVRERPNYKIVELTLGSGEGRLIDAKCRIKDGKVTHTYE